MAYKLIETRSGIAVDVIHGLTAGREKGTHLYSHLTKMSRSHFTLTFEGQNAFIEDLNSSNGTFLNGTRLAARTKTRLKHEDRIVAGDGEFVFKDASIAKKVSAPATAAYTNPIVRPSYAAPVGSMPSKPTVSELWSEFKTLRGWHFVTYAWLLCIVLGTAFQVKTVVSGAVPGAPNSALGMLIPFLVVYVPIAVGTLFLHYWSTQTIAKTGFKALLATLPISLLPTVGLTALELNTGFFSKVAQNQIFRNCRSETYRSEAGCREVFTPLHLTLAKLNKEERAAVQEYLGGQQKGAMVAAVAAGSKPGASEDEKQAATSSAYVLNLSKETERFTEFHERIKGPDFCPKNWDCFFTELKKYPMESSTGLTLSLAALVSYSVRQKAFCEKDALCLAKLKLQMTEGMVSVLESVKLDAFHSYRAEGSGADFMRLLEDTIFIKASKAIDGKIATYLQEPHPEFDRSGLAARFERIRDLPAKLNVLSVRITPEQLDRVLQEQVGVIEDPKQLAEIKEQVLAYQASRSRVPAATQK